VRGIENVIAALAEQLRARDALGLVVGTAGSYVPGANHLLLAPPQLPQGIAAAQAVERRYSVQAAGELLENWRWSPGAPRVFHFHSSITVIALYEAVGRANVAWDRLPPFVLSVHNERPQVEAEGLAYVTERIARPCDTIVTVSAAHRGQFADLLDAPGFRGRSVVIQQPVAGPPEDWEPHDRTLLAPARIDLVYAQAGLGGRPRYLGPVGADPSCIFVGHLCRLGWRKGTTLFLDVIRRLNDTVGRGLQRRFVGVLVGPPDPADTLEFFQREIASRLDEQTVWLGPAQPRERWSAYRAFDVHLLPSLSEPPADLAPVESMLVPDRPPPVVSTGRGSHAETVVDGVSGYCLAPRYRYADWDTMVRELCALVMAAVDLDRRGIQGAGAPWCPSRITARYLEVYTEGLRIVAATRAAASSRSTQ
jgi:glycosyltransferase involved in cell wall biosynthesis